MQPVLDVRHLSIDFSINGTIIQAVQDVSFFLMPGETLALVGESGSGKSVTSLATVGLLPSTAQVRGEVWLRRSPDDAPVNLLTLAAKQQRKYRGSGIAMVFQEPMTSLNPVLTCGQQVVEAIRLHNAAISQRESYQQAVHLFQEVRLPDPAGMMRRYPHQLSGGQIQRVMIAMALSGNPTILIADEPTTALDMTIQATILKLLQDIRQNRQMAILFITHDMGVVSTLADRVVVMFKGRVVEMAGVYDLFANPQHPYTQGLLYCRPTPNCPRNRLPTLTDFIQVNTIALEEIAIAPQAREVIDTNPRFAVISPSEKASHAAQLAQQLPLLSVQNLTKTFPIRRRWWKCSDEMRVVDNVSFAVYPGETLGLVGESGCGKTTLSRVLLRLIEPTAGEIWFEGQSVVAMNAEQLRRLRRNMQIVFQNPFGSLDARQQIGSALEEPMIIHRIATSPTERRQRAIALLERVGLDARAMHRYPHEFSGGQRQRICIARTLTCQPRFIIYDESVSALDVSVQAQVLNLLKDLQQELGLTYIFISHDLNVVKFVSDRIMVMHQGRIEEIGIAESIYTNPQTKYTRQLIQAIPNATLDEMRSRQEQRSPWQKGLADP